MKTTSTLEFHELRAVNVMRTDVVTLSADDTIQVALATFEDHRIGGAPVTDGTGKIVGVLTLSDVARTEHLSGDRMRSERGTVEMSEVPGEENEDELDPNEVFFAKSDYSTDLAGKDRVADWMTVRVITVAPNARLTAVCTKMVKHHIHRVFVIENHRLAGVISSFDVVRCVAGTLETRSLTKRAAD